MGLQSQNIRPPSCLMDAHSMAMKNGHQQESQDICEKYIHSSGRCLLSNCSSAIWSMSVPAWKSCINPQLTESTTMTEMLRLVNVTPLGSMQVSTHTASLHLWRCQNPCFLFHQATVHDQKKHIFFRVQKQLILIRSSHLNHLDTLYHWSKKKKKKITQHDSWTAHWYAA